MTLAREMSVPVDFYEQVAHPESWKSVDKSVFDENKVEVLYHLPNGALLIEHPIQGDEAPVYIVNHERTRVAPTHWHCVSDLLSDLLG